MTISTGKKKKGEEEGGFLTSPILDPLLNIFRLKPVSGHGAHINVQAHFDLEELGLVFGPLNKQIASLFAEKKIHNKYTW